MVVKRRDLSASECEECLCAVEALEFFNLLGTKPYGKLCVFFVAGKPMPESFSLQGIIRAERPIRSRNSSLKPRYNWPLPSIRLLKVRSVKRIGKLPPSNQIPHPRGNFDADPPLLPVPFEILSLICQL